MAILNNFKVSELDFDQIKSNLLEFLQAQKELTDYNFEGSVLNTLVDLMAYTTHYNAFNANMALNESFLDTAQLRSSVVSHAKLLGYTPRSALAARAMVDVKVFNPYPAPDPSDISDIATSETNLYLNWQKQADDEDAWLSLELPKGTQFSTSINKKEYTYLTTESVVINHSENATTSGDQPDYIFKDVELTQGEYRTTKYIYSSQSSELYIIPFENVVTSTIKVTVQKNKDSSPYEYYHPAPNIVNVKPTSKIFWVQESREGYYELIFGDGIIGQSLSDGNVINIECIVTSSPANISNGSSVFSIHQDLLGSNNIIVDTVMAAVGGAPREDINSIKYTAPVEYVSQNRAITPEDYKAIILADYPNIRAINVWGGEDNIPPNYGKVYICIAPLNSSVNSTTSAPALTYEEKQFIKTKLLKPKNIVSITPEFTDPLYTYISLDVSFKYNSNITKRNAVELSTEVSNNILEYYDLKLRHFDGVFRFSNLLTLIDSTDVAISNSVASVYVKKRFIVNITGGTSKYVITFPIALLNNNQKTIIYSNAFIFNNQQCIFKDILREDGQRIIYIVSTTDDAIIKQIGVVSPGDGIVTLNEFKPVGIVEVGISYIEITASPNSYDIAPNRNELLTLVSKDISITGEIDSMLTGTTNAGIDYITTARGT
jgi:hypothetical protein